MAICIQWFGFYLMSIIIEGRCLHNAWVAAVAKKIGECLMNFIVGESISISEIWASSSYLLFSLSFRAHSGNV